MKPVRLPDALLLLAPGCAHCPRMLAHLGKLIEQGRLGRLEVVNVAEHPQAGARTGSRSVPWTRLGEFELEGLQSYRELEQWADYAARDAGLSAYYAHLLEHRHLDKAIALARRSPSTLPDLLGLLGSEDTPMGTRIGISAVMEDLQGSGKLDSLIPELGQLTLSSEPQTRADACHFLGLTGNPEAIRMVRPLLDDSHEDVREIALETLAVLGAET